MRVSLTHLEAPLVHAGRPSVVVSVLVLLAVALLVILMAGRRGTPVTLGRRGGLHVGGVVVLGDGRLGRALSHSLIFAVATVGWREQHRTE